MDTYRKIKKTVRSKETVDGAGVKLNRVFGYYETPDFDPFLLLDDFHSDNPDDYMAGFPWHPHRGIETVTYMIKGKVEHQDSLGNKGIIQAGEIQWMTAGSGIIHQEMPVTDNTGIWGFQLWVNLPASHKMTTPRYQDIKAGQVPVVTLPDGVVVRVMAGSIEGVSGPVKDVIAEPEYYDITIPPGKTFIHKVHPDHTVAAYIAQGSGTFEAESERVYKQGTALLYSHGEAVSITAENEGCRFLLLKGKPIGEPIAWRGPIVMNTEEELSQAFSEFHDGSFIK